MVLISQIFFILLVNVKVERKSCYFIKLQTINRNIYYILKSQMKLLTIFLR